MTVEVVDEWTNKNTESGSLEGKKKSISVKTTILRANVASGLEEAKRGNIILEVGPSAAGKRDSGDIKAKMWP